MKYLLFTLVVLCIAGVASAQGVVPKLPATPNFEAPVGVKHIPKNITKDTPWKARDSENLKAYERAMTAYKGALKQRKRSSVPADKTVPVPMPTLTPDPNLNLKTPILTPDPDVDLKMLILTPEPPATLKMLPDSLRKLPVPPKKYPMKFPRK